MKKLLPVLLLSAVLTIGSAQAFANESADTIPQKPSKEQQMKVRQSFEKRLNLTEEQKTKAKKIHQKGAKQMKSLMDKKIELKKEIRTIKKSDLDETKKHEQISKKFKEMRKLDKKAHQIRKQNGKDFEKILTDEQKNELAKMKSEGRKRFEKKHPPRPPFGMFGPDFKGGEKGIFPPPPPPKEEK